MSSTVKYFDSGDVKSLLTWPFRDQRNAFEKEFASYLGARHAISTSYGRTALYLGLRAIGAEGGEVLLPAFACTVVRQAIVRSGAVPCFVDVDFETFDIDLNDAQNKISPRTRALIFIHYFGRIARNMKAVKEFARQNGLVLIEDCAHSLGAEFEGRKVGTFGDLAIFSLTKNMINFGGGFLVTNNASLYAKAREILSQEQGGLIASVKDLHAVFSYGIEQMIRKLHFDRVGNRKRWWLFCLPRLVLKTGNYLVALLKVPQKIFSRAPEKKDYGHSILMPPVIASLGRNQLKKIDILIERRKIIYRKLAQSPFFHFRNGVSENTGDVCTNFVLRFSGKDIFETIERCEEQGLHLLTTWTARQKKWKHLDSWNMRRIEKEILVMSLNPDLTDREIEQFTGILGRLDVPAAHAPDAYSPIKNSSPRTF